jgi:y4mF family transcriptional regulator
LIPYPINFFKISVPHFPVRENFACFLVKTIDFPVREYYIYGMDIQKTEDLSKAIKGRRKSLKLTQAECAAFCGVGLRFFSELENGKQSLHLGKVMQVLQMLGLKMQIIGNEES